MIPMPSDRFKQIGLWSAALVLGLACGRLLHSAIGSSNGAGTTGQSAAGQESSDKRSHRSSLMSSTSRYLWRETAELRNPETYDSAVERLHRESLSPLRAVSLQSHRIQNSTFEEWEHLIAEGKVSRLETLGEVGAYLARLDSERALRLLFHGPTRFDTLDHFYAFRDAVVATITKTDPQMVFDALKRMKRGGAQMDNGRFFSESWAKTDPQAAADHFDELMPLRNMGLEGSTPKIPYDEFSRIILKSWISKDLAGAEAYLAGLPPSPKRDALEAALGRMIHKPPQ
jgi:hypothetical protein